MKLTFTISDDNTTAFLDAMHGLADAIIHVKARAGDPPLTADWEPTTPLYEAKKTSESQEQFVGRAVNAIVTSYVKMMALANDTVRFAEEVEKLLPPAEDIDDCLLYLEHDVC
jgi:hypothetical protein